LRDILLEALRPFISRELPNIVMSGPLLLLAPLAALGMTVHELMANALKYGALSVPEGTVSVSWSVDPDRLVLLWVERNGPAVVKPERPGFGMTLIERGFAHDVGGDAVVDFQPEGVVALLRAPLPVLGHEGG
jgi:two-component sensor histidine kinase